MIVDCIGAIISKNVLLHTSVHCIGVNIPKDVCIGVHIPKNTLLHTSVHRTVVI